MSDQQGLSLAERDRITRLETQLENLSAQVRDVRGDLKDAVAEWRKALDDFKLALVQQKYLSKAALDAPINRFTGAKLTLVAIGSLVIFFVTVIGGVLGIAAYFRH